MIPTCNHISCFICMSVALPWHTFLLNYASFHSVIGHFMIFNWMLSAQKVNSTVHPNAIIPLYFTTYGLHMYYLITLSYCLSELWINIFLGVFFHLVVFIWMLPGRQSFSGGWLDVTTSLYVYTYACMWLFMFSSLLMQS